MPLVRAVPVTSETGQERMPALTNDGRQVVYAAQVDAELGYDLFVKTLGSDTALRVTDTPGQSEMTPVWSPDANQVAFYRYENDQCGLFVKPIMGGFERRLADCAADAITYIDWSSDGDTIAMTGRVDESTTVAGIILLDVASGELRPLSYDQSHSDHDVQPKFSPDGKSLAFRRGAFPRSELFLVAREGGSVRQLTDFGSQIFGFDWLPDGRRIWLCSDQAGRVALWQLDLTTGISQLLEFGCPHMLSVARNRDVMVFEHIEEDPNIVETVTAGGGQHVNLPVFTSTQAESYPAYSPDGRRIVYVSDRTGHEQLWIGDLVTEESFQLTRLQAMKLIRPRWSPDGRFVVYLGRGGGIEAMYKIDVLSGLVERISSEGEIIRSADVSNDGSRVFYSSDMSGDWEVWSLRLSDGERQRITRHGGHRPLDPFGDGFVYYTKLDVFGLWRMSVNGGEEELVSDEVSFYNHESWSINDTGLYLALSEEGQELAVFRIDLADSWNREKMIDADSDDILRMHDVSADGERFLMIRVQSPKQDIMTVSGW
jgi:Tol biopolymer transport system component